MRTRILGGILSALVCFALFCCKQENKEYYKNILSTVRQNAEAADNEDIEAYIKTLDEDSPAFELTKKNMIKYFEKFDLSIKLENLAVKEASGEEAKVDFVQVTRGGPGSDYNDHRMKGVHLLRKTDEKWKIYKTEVRNFEYLGEPPQ